MTIPNIITYTNYKPRLLESVDRGHMLSHRDTELASMQEQDAKIHRRSRYSDGPDGVASVLVIEGILAR